MSQTYKYSLYRINMLLTLFRSEYAIYTINELADMLEVPKSVIREDIYLLSKGIDECETVIFPYEDDVVYTDETDDSEGKKISLDPDGLLDEEAYREDNNHADIGHDDFLKRLKKGQCDDVPLGAYSRFKSDIFLPLNHNELKVLDDFMPDKQFGMRFSEGGVYMKSSPYKESDKVQKIIAELNEYIMAGDSIMLTIRLSDGRFKRIMYKPLCIVRYNLENVTYVVSVGRKRLFPIRVDRIYSMSRLDESIEIEDYSPLNNLALMWKMDSSEKIDVRLHITGPKHIRRKIKKDIFNMRISYESMVSSKIKEYIEIKEKDVLGRYTEGEDYDIYEGSIIGISAFRNWIHGYGSSVIVVSPASLREDIIRSLEERCKKYSEE